MAKREYFNFKRRDDLLKGLMDLRPHFTLNSKLMTLLTLIQVRWECEGGMGCFTFNKFLSIYAYGAKRIFLERPVPSLLYAFTMYSINATESVIR